MNNKNETTPAGGDSEFDLGFQKLANLADKMGELNFKDQPAESSFNSKGIHKETGTRYDQDGYDFEGYNQYGVDREGYSRKGYNKEGYDREGYNRNGLDRGGFGKDRLYLGPHTHKKSLLNPRGFDGNRHNHFTNSDVDWQGFNFDDIYAETGEKYDPYGFDAKHRHKVGYRDPKGNFYDTDFERDENNVDYRGFKDFSDINVRTGTKYDLNGFDKEGYDENGMGMDGYDRDGFNKDGIDRRGYGRDGYNSEGVDREGYGRDGYNDEGLDRDGYGRDGYNSEGLDRYGYNREGLDRDGNTREFNAKFNEYGVDEKGYQKNGEIDPDVEFAIDFAESGIKDQNKYALEKNIDEKEVRDKIGMARKKCPNIDEIVSNLLLTGNKMRVAAIMNDCGKLKDGSMEISEFWDKHPKLTITNVLSNFVDNMDDRKSISNKTIESIIMDSDNIENNLQIFGASRYDVQEAIKGVEEFKKIYSGLTVDGSPEQARTKRENTKKLFDIIKYLNKYKNRNLDSLLGMRQSKDGGKTWIEFSGESIGRAMDALKKDGKLICVQTVKDYMLRGSE